MLENIDFKNILGAQDVPDNRDYTIEEVLGESGTAAVLPRRVIIDITKPLNQWNRGACTVFGNSGAYFETLAQALDTVKIEYSQPYDPWTVWDKAIAEKWASDTKGWTHQGALQFLTDLWLIGWYVRVIDGASAVQAIKRRISEGKWIGTGTAKGNWEEIVRTGEWHEWQEFRGHIHFIAWYDDDKKFENGEVGWVYFPNSWGGIGAFWMSYKDLGKLYTKYIPLLPEEKKYIIEAKKKRRTALLQKAFEYKLWDESRPNDKATDMEIVKIIHRAMKMDESALSCRAFYAVLFEERIVRWKAVIVWNKQNGEKDASAGEIAIMFTRAAMRNGWISELALSRQQVVEIVARDILS